MQICEICVPNTTSLKLPRAGRYSGLTDNCPPDSVEGGVTPRGIVLVRAQIGQQAPPFSVQAYDRTQTGCEDEFIRVSLADLKGKWVCLYFYPLDFTAVCPTEIVSFNESLNQFQERECVVLTASTDSVFTHKGWCDSNRDLAGLKHLMLSDTTHEMCRAYGVLKEDAGIAYRGVFLIDPTGIVRWLAIYDLDIGRDVNEVLRVLDALQTDKMCPCNWKPGQATID